MRKINHYFVSYIFNDKNSNTGYGNAEVNWEYGIRNMNDINDIQKELVISNKSWTSCIILNYQLLKEEIN